MFLDEDLRSVCNLQDNAAETVSLYHSVQGAGRLYLLVALAPKNTMSIELTVKLICPLTTSGT